jgi:hypothetical protein
VATNFPILKYSITDLWIQKDYTNGSESCVMLNSILNNDPDSFRQRDATSDHGGAIGLILESAIKKKAIVKYCLKNFQDWIVILRSRYLQSFFQVCDPALDVWFF